MTARDAGRGGVGRGLAAAAVAAPAAWAVYSTWFVHHAVPLPAAIDAERRTVATRSAGRLTYYADDRGEGPPLVLLHSVNAAASSYEVGPLFAHYRGCRPVYALDLPGFGFSERADREYTPALYADAIHEFLRAVLPERGAADVLALSLAGEFAGMVAARSPERVRSLALVSPTGFSMPKQRSAGQKRADGGANVAQKVLGLPFLGQPLFDALVTRPSIGFFLKQSFAGPVPPGMVEYCWASAHQPGARFAPIAFVSGRLFTPDVRERFYVKVTAPALVLHDDAPYGTFDALPALTAAHPNWRGARVGPTRGLPQFEDMPRVAALLEEFWATAR